MISIEDKIINTIFHKTDIRKEKGLKDDIVKVKKTGFFLSLKHQTLLILSTKCHSETIMPANMKGDVNESHLISLLIFLQIVLKKWRLMIMI